MAQNSLFSSSTNVNVQSMRNQIQEQNTEKPDLSKVPWFVDHYRDYYSFILSNEEMLYMASQIDEQPLARVQYDMQCRVLNPNYKPHG